MGTPSASWRLRTVRGEDGRADTVLESPEGSAALRLEPDLSPTDLTARIDGLPHQTPPAPLVFPDEASRVAFALGASRGSHWTPVVRFEVVVADERPAVADTISVPTPTRGPNPLDRPLFELRKLASWHGGSDRRVREAYDDLLRLGGATPQIASQADTAVREGDMVLAAMGELSGLAYRVGGDHPRLLERLEFHCARIPWKGFRTAALKKIAASSASGLRGRAARDSVVCAHGVDHRLTSQSPCPQWTLLIDEGGAIPEALGQPAEGVEGRFVGLLVPQTVTLPALPSGWHAVDQPDPREIDRVVQAILDAPVGIHGITLSILPTSSADAWVTGVVELVHHVLGLIPLGDGMTRLEVLIEQRGEHVAGAMWRAVTAAVLRDLALHDPERAARIALSLRLVSKHDAALNGYVDALAFTWSSPSPASRDRLAKSGLEHSCLLSGDPRVLRTLRDALVDGATLSPDAWRALTARADAHRPGTFAAGLLDRLRGALRGDPARWSRHLDGVRTHLDSKSVDLVALGREVSLLASCAPSNAELPPSVRLAWATARLEAANHEGATRDDVEAELAALAGSLFDELPTLACQADLVRAVLATNRFDVAGATHALARWSEVAPAVPGLRHWGRVRSSLGQHAAFSGDHARAGALFDEADAAFARLSEAGLGERRQTATYAAIAATDDPAREPSEVRARIATMLGEEPTTEIIAALAADGSAGRRYAHHAVVRWISHRGDVAARDAYLAARARWTTGYGHPWSLIELHRALILHDVGAPPDEVEQQLHASIEAGWTPSGGPTVRFISLVTVAVAGLLGALDPSEHRALADALAPQLPHAPWPPLREALANRWTQSPRALLAACLPFNFG